VIFLSIALYSGWEDVIRGFRVSPGGITWAVALNGLGLVALAGSWAAIHERGSRAKTFYRYLSIQPVKHVPGGIAYPVSAIGSSASVSVGEATARFLLHSLVLLCGGLTIGGLLVLDVETRPVGFLSLCGAAVVGLIVLRWRVSGAVDAFLARLVNRFFGPSSGRSPSAPARLHWRTLLAATVLAVVGLGGLAGGFSLIAASIESFSGPILLISAFSFAWAVGYAAVPFPSGIGIREGVLAFVVAGGTGLMAPIAAAALLHRLCQIMSEGLCSAIGFGANAVRERRLSKYPPSGEEPSRERASA
jgi:hypothetical protein